MPKYSNHASSLNDDVFSSERISPSKLSNPWFMWMKRASHPPHIGNMVGGSEGNGSMGYKMPINDLAPVWLVLIWTINWLHQCCLRVLAIRRYLINGFCICCYLAWSQGRWLWWITPLSINQRKQSRSLKMRDVFLCFYHLIRQT